MQVDLVMAWRNIFRNKRRSILTICAIAFASLLLVFMFSWQFGSYETMINASVMIRTGHLQVQAKGYKKNMDIRKALDQPSAIGKMLDSIPQVESYTFRANAFSLASSHDRTYGILLTGIDPEREGRVSTLQDIIRKGRFLEKDDMNQALAGWLLAKNLKVDTGDEITLIGQGRDGSVAATVVTVKGIFNSGIDEYDRGAMQMSLSGFQEVFSMREGVHQVVVNCKSLSDVEIVQNRLENEISSRFPEKGIAVWDWKTLNPGLVQSIKMDLSMGVIYYIILIIVVAFSILNTFLMAVFERTREFGVMMAIGTKPGRIMKILMAESLSMTIIGVVSGVIFGVALTYYFQVHGIDITGMSEALSRFGISGRIYPRLSFLSITIGPSMVLVITVIAAMYPALKIRKLDPVEALAFA